MPIASATNSGSTSAISTTAAARSLRSSRLAAADSERADNRRRRFGQDMRQAWRARMKAASPADADHFMEFADIRSTAVRAEPSALLETGRASRRERGCQDVEISGVAETLKKKQ